MEQTNNRPFARWRHFFTTTRILFVFLFIFKFGNPSEILMTKVVICKEKKTLKDSGRSSK